ncbi:MAG: HPr(Ser) kinase/phosphatase [Halofilum sp. (in: g-proteobacteria)]|nr:HPr(Ser) kinase/phosphatase [Halofilum sp. (in: g-proteobacteria)]
MSRSPSLAELFDRLQEELALEAVVPASGHMPGLPTEPLQGGTPTLIGHLNLIQGNRIQVFGPTELDYWEDLDGEERVRRLGDLFDADLYGIIVTDGRSIPEDVLAQARADNVPVYRTSQRCEHIISSMRHELARAFAAHVVMHGVFLNVLGVGVLLVGASSVGKSELALELISRGHALVADDAPEFRRLSPDTVEGSAPAILEDFLEVSGLGILNIRAMYGNAAIRHHKQLELIINLEPLTGALRAQLDRLNGNLTTSDVLGVRVAAMTLPVAPGRNMAVMVEAAVRNFLLSHDGYHAAEDLMLRQRREIERDDP